MQGFKYVWNQNENNTMLTEHGDKISKKEKKSDNHEKPLHDEILNGKAVFHSTWRKLHCLIFKNKLEILSLHNLQA